MTEVRAKKALGQHFLVDLNIARKICDALSGAKTDNAVASENTVLPGTGPVRRDGESTLSDAEHTQPAGADDPFAGEERSLPKADNPCWTADDIRSGTDAALPGAGRMRHATATEDALPGADDPYSGSDAADAETECSASAGCASGCDVLEVGCGMGVLTQFLLRRTDLVVWGAEIDAESVDYLHRHYPAFAPRLIEGDFLRLDLRARFPHGVRIIGNFPYNISSQIFFKILENRDLVSECVGMIQKEVAVRLAEGPGSKEYGILSVLLQAWYDIEYLFTVSEKVFNPPPKVKSAVVRLRRNATVRLGCDEGLFIRVVKAAFGQRRKMIRNALRAVFGDFGGAEHPFFSRRAEQLSVAEFVELTEWVAANRAANRAADAN